MSTNRSQIQHQYASPMRIPNTNYLVAWGIIVAMSSWKRTLTGLARGNVHDQTYSPTPAYITHTLVIGGNPLTNPYI